MPFLHVPSPRDLSFGAVHRRLTAVSSTRLHGFVSALLREYPQSVEVTCLAVADLVEDAFVLLKEEFAATLTLSEVAVLVIQLLRECTPLLLPAASALPSLTQLKAVARIALTLFGIVRRHHYSAEFWFYLTGTEKDPGQVTQSRNSWWFPVRYLELALRTPGALTRTTVSGIPDDDLFTLDGTEEIAKPPFSRVLRQLRVKSGRSQKRFADNFCAWGCKQVAISSWERGAVVPSRGQAILVHSIAIHFECPDLYRAWIAARETLERAHPRAQARDIDFSAYLLPYSGLVDRLIRLPRYPRVAGNTLETRRLDLAWLMASAGLPQENPARIRGLGWSAPLVTPLLILNLEAIDSFVSLAGARSGDGKDHSLCRQLTCHRLARLTGPGGGFHTCAEELATLVTDVDLTWLTLYWPPNSDLAGRPCKSVRDRIVAQTYVAHQRYCRLAQQSRGSTKRRHSALLVLRRTHAFPLVGVCRFLHRLPLTVPTNLLLTDDGRDAALVASFAVAAIFRPIGNDEQEFFQWEMQCSDGHYHLLIWEPGGVDAPPMLRRTIELPVAANPFLEPWHQLRRQLGPSTLPYYLRSNGRPHNLRSFHYTVRRIVKRWSADLFPNGLAPQDWTTIVATEILTRLGRGAGLPLAAFVCRQATSAILRRHILRVPQDDSSLLSSVTADLADCFRLALAEADVASNPKAPAPPRLRRTRAEIRRTGRRKPKRRAT